MASISLPGASSTHAEISENTNINRDASMNIPGGHDADTVESAMGNLLDNVQEHIDFPLDSPGSKPSTSMMYDIAAKLSVEVHSNWRLFDGFELTEVGLSVAISKTTRSKAMMKIALKAKMTIGDTDITLKGEIPLLENDKDTDFVLTITASNAQESIPFDELLNRTSSAAVTLDKVKGAIEPEIAEEIFLSRAGGYAASASVTITRLAATKSYQVKSFEARILGKFDWDIVTDKLRLRNAWMTIVAHRQKPTLQLDWTLGLNGSLLVGTDTAVDLSGQFVVENAVCTGFNAKIVVGSLQNLTLPALFDAAVGSGGASEAQKDFNLPPSLRMPTNSTFPPLLLAITLSKSPGGWSLSRAEALLFLNNLSWSPLPGITLESLLFSLSMWRNPQPGGPETKESNQIPGPLSSTNSGTIQYGADLRGVLRFLDIPLAAEVKYNPGRKDLKDLTIQATVSDDTVCSLQNLCSDLSEKIANSTDPINNPKYDLKPIADGATVPIGCPVYTNWALHGNFASRRQCVLRLVDSKLVRASFTATYQGPQFAWQLSKGLRIVEAGLFFDASFNPPASTSNPSILAFVYGRLTLTKGTTLFGFVACSKTLDYQQFDVLLTIHEQPNASLGMSPKDVIEDKSLTAQPFDTNGWSVPVSIPQDCSLEETCTSFDAIVKVSFMSNSLSSPTVFTAVKVSLRASGTWKVMNDLQLKDFTLGIIATRPSSAPDAPFSFLVSLYGRAQISVGSSNFDIWCHAMLDRKDHSTDFRAIVTACTAGTAAEPPESSQLSPTQLAQLDFLGHFELTMPVDQSPPEDCPVKLPMLMNSLSASCELHVTRQGDVQDWVLTDVNFRLVTSSPWTLIPSRLVLSIGALEVMVFQPRDNAKRSFVARLTASMTIGTSTILDASLTFSRLGRRPFILGDLSAASLPEIDIARMAKELVPQQSDSTIPAGSTNLDMLTKSEIHFWLDAVQPTMIILGASSSGSLLYFLHRPDMQKDEYYWLLNMSITNLSMVFPWIDSSVTGAFSLKDVGIEMINRPIQVEKLVAFLALGENVGVTVPQQVSPLALLRTLDQNAQLDAGAWFFATINLGGGGSMMDTLTLAMSPDSGGQIILYANVRAERKSMDCALCLSNIRIFGDSLVLDGTINYSPLSSSINGTASVAVTDLSSQSRPQFMASISMTKEETEISAKLSVGQTIDVESPFDTMYNTNLTLVQVVGSFRRGSEIGKPPSSTMTISGSLRLGQKDSTWSISAKVVFVDGKARVAVGTIGKTDTRVIADKLLKPGTPESSGESSWPTNFPAFDFESASIYYAKSVKPNEAPLVVDGVTYQFGYCLSATLILFGSPFVVTARLPENRSGLRILGSYEAVIDLTFAKLLGYEFDGKTLPWPSLEIDTTNNNRTYTARTGIVLFGIEGFDISLSYETIPSKGRLKGTIQYNKDLLNVPNPKISLAYEDSFLYIDDWPFRGNGEDHRKDYLQEAVRQASSEVGCEKCGDLVELVLDKTIQTEFDFSLGKPRDGRNPVSGQTYVGSIKWSYVVSVTVPFQGKTEIGRLNMDPVDLTIDKGFTADSIWQSLLKLIGQQILNVGKALMNDPVKFAALIALMNMKGVVTKILSNLLCREVDEENVKEEASKTVNENQSEPSSRASKVRDTFKAVRGVGSFVAALGLFGEGVAAFGAFLGLGSLFGAGTSLSAHLLPFLSDKGMIGRINELLGAYGRLQTESEELQAQAMQHLLLTAKPSAAPASSWIKDTPNEASVSVVWSNSMPKPAPGAPADYFGDFKIFQWQVAYSAVDDPKATSGITLLNPTADRSCIITDPALMQQRDIFVWVRSVFTLDGKIATSDWSPGNPPLHHPLWLPTPKGISVSIKNAPAYDQVTVDVAEPKKTSFRVAFANDEQGTTSPVYQHEITDGSSTLNAPVLDFLFKAGTTNQLRGFIQELTSDATKFRDSPWKISDTALQVTQEELRLTVRQVSSSDALLEWNSLGSEPSAFTFLVTNPDGSRINSSVVNQTPGARIKIQLNSSHFKDGVSAIFALRRNPSGPNILQAFTKQTLSFHAPLTISNESFFDAETQRLEIYLNSITNLSAGQAATVTLHAAQGSQQVASKIEFSDGSKMLAKLIAVPIKSPYPGQIDVSITLDSDQTNLQSPQWPFPVVADAPFAKNFHSHVVDNVLNVYWDVQNPVVSCRMGLVATNLSLLSQGVDLPEGQYKGKYSASFTGKDLDVLKGNNKAKIQIWCIHQLGTVKSKEKICWLPDLSLWSAPEQAINSSSVAPTSSVASMSTVAGSLGALWWLSSDVNMIEGNVKTDNADNWKSVNLEANEGSMPLASGSSLASLSRSSNHQEVFWIDRQGAIQGQWRNGGDFIRGIAYTFQGAGTSATKRGGSLAAVSCLTGTMDLWYVTPDGRIMNAHWNNNRRSGWGNPIVVTNHANATDTTLSMLTVCVTGPGSIELFWIQQTTVGMWTVQNQRCSNTDAASPIYEGQLVTDSGDPALNSKPHALYVESKGTMIAWITSMGGVRMAMRKAVSSGEQPPWQALWDVAPAHTASPRSCICSGTWDVGAVFPSLYWVADDGSVTVAEYASETTAAGSRLCYEYWASFKHTTNIVWRTNPEPLAEIVVCSGTADSVRLFWVGGDSNVKTMRYPKQGAKPWP